MKQHTVKMQSVVRTHVQENSLILIAVSIFGLTLGLTLIG